MKYLKILFLVLATTTFIKAQEQNITLKMFNCFLSGIPSGKDSLRRPVLREDSLELKCIIAFNHLNNEVKEIYLNIGNEKNSSNGLQKTFTISKNGELFFINGLRHNGVQLAYGDNIFFIIRIVKTNNLNWATVSYKDTQNRISEKSYFKLN